MNDRIKNCSLTITLLMIPFVWALSNSMIIPILPQIQSELAITKVQSGLLITALSVPTAIMLPFTGFLSDRCGRIPVMVAALSLYGLGGLAAGISSMARNYYLLLGARIIQGIGASGTNLLALSYAGDICTGKQRAQTLSLLEASNSTGKLLSPLLGTATAMLLWYLPFFVYPIICAIAIIGLLLFKIQPQCTTKRESLRSYFLTLWEILHKKSRSLVCAMICTLITVFIWFGNLYFLSDLMAEQMHISSLTRGLLLSIPIISMVITAIITGRYLQRFSRPKTIIAGLFLNGSTLIAATCLPQAFLLYGMVALIGVGMGLILPSLNYLIIGCVSDHQRGIVAAAYGSVRSLGSALAPVGFGLIMSYSRTLTLLVAGILTMLGATLAGFINEAELTTVDTL